MLCLLHRPWLVLHGAHTPLSLLFAQENRLREVHQLTRYKLVLDSGCPLPLFLNKVSACEKQSTRVHLGTHSTWPQNMA